MAIPVMCGESPGVGATSAQAVLDRKASCIPKYAAEETTCAQMPCSKRGLLGQGSMISLSCINLNARTWTQFVTVFGIVGNASSVVALIVLAEMFMLSRAGNYVLLTCHVALGLASIYFLVDVCKVTRPLLALIGKRSHQVVRHLPYFLLAETVFVTGEAIALAFFTAEYMDDICFQTSVEHFICKSHPAVPIIYFIVVTGLSYVYMVTNYSIQLTP